MAQKGNLILRQRIFGNMTSQVRILSFFAAIILLNLLPIRMFCMCSMRALILVQKPTGALILRAMAAFVLFS
jgi:hypothetical protein